MDRNPRNPVAPPPPYPSGHALWPLAAARGLGRSRFLELLLAGGPASVLAARDDAGVPTTPPPLLEPVPVPPPEPEPPHVAPFFRDTTSFIEHGRSLKARLEDMPGLTTPERTVLPPQQRRQQRKGFPGGSPFDGARWNDVHHTTAAKRAARKRRSAELCAKLLPKNTASAAAEA